MTTDDATEKEARRAAYATYVACFWRLRRLPAGDLARSALALATQRAEADWRALMAQAQGGERAGGVPASAERGATRCGHRGEAWLRCADRAGFLSGGRYAAGPPVLAMRPEGKARNACSRR